MKSRFDVKAKAVPLLLVIVALYMAIAGIEYNRVLYPEDIVIQGLKRNEKGIVTGEIDGNIKTVPGDAIVSALIDVLKNMEKDWMPNDIQIWPTVILDNPQNYQEGQLYAVKQILFVLLQKVARMNPTEPENPHLAKAVSAINIDPASWMMPAFEDQLQLAINELDIFRSQIRKGEVRLPDRKDTFAELLKVLGVLLGSSVGQLGNAPHIGEFTITTITAGDTHTQGEKILSKKETQTPWSKVDDVFYNSQGVMFVVNAVFAATLVDFRNLIRSQNSTELGQAVFLIMDPYYYGTSPLFVSNGDPLSMWPNHSLALQAILVSGWVDMVRLSLAVSGQ